MNITFLSTFGKKALELSLYLLSFLASLSVATPIVGTVFSYLGLNYGLFAITLATASAAFFTPIVRKCLGFISLIDGVNLLLITVVFALAIKSWAPVLQLRQDPGLYLFKALNLVNYGTLSKPMDTLTKALDKKDLKPEVYEGYSRIHNGADFQVGRLHPDFFDGGAAFGAFFGFFKRPLVLVAPILLSYIGILLFYILLLKSTNSSGVSLFGSLVMVLCPAYVWFSRAPYSENIAFVIFSLSAITLASIDKDSWKVVLFSILTLIAGYFTRVEYMFLPIIGIGLLTHYSIKWGAFMLAAGLLGIQAVQQVYPIYYSLNSTIFFVIYDSWILIGIFISSILLFHYLKVEPDRIINWKIAWASLFVAFGGVLLFVFRNNLIPPEEFETAWIHGRLLRTYNEETIDRLFVIFPAIVFVAGYLSIPYFLRDAKLSLYGRVFIVALLLPFSYALYNSMNSPQIWWNLRRYTYVILPCAVLSFSFLLAQLESRTRAILSLAVLLTSSNIFAALNPKIDFEGLDRSLIKFIRAYPEDRYLLLYNPVLRYEVSPIISYGKYDFLPVSNVKQLSAAIKNSSRKEILFVTRAPFKDEKNDSLYLSMIRVGEDYGGPPTETYVADYVLYFQDARSVLKRLKKEKGEFPA